MDDINGCLNTDLTTLQNTNLKAEVQLFKGNKITLFNNFAKKVRNARGADDLHPIETTTPQGAVSSSFGKYLWNTGPNPTYKFGDQWVVSDRFLVDLQYAHVGNNFILDFHSPELADVQPTLIVSTGLNGRSAATQSVFIRPVNSLTLNTNYFVPGVLGADHALRIGGYWRDSNTTSISHRGGFATVRYPTSLSNDCSLAATGCAVDLARDGNSVYDLLNYSAYAQDTVTKGRLTLQLGVRYDYIKDKALASTIVANPLGGPWLPGIDFPGADPGVAFNTFSPRLGLNYDVSQGGKTVAHANYARYYGQVGNGGVAATVNPVSQTILRYPWVDANKNGVADPGEVVLSANPQALVQGNWSAANPAATVSANSVDPKLKDDSTDEFIVGLDHEIGAGFAVGANYIWRRYGNIQWDDKVGIQSSDWAPVSFTPTGCPGADNRTQAANCPSVTYYQPTFQQPTIIFTTNAAGYNRTYNGFEITGRKRMANHWLMNTSFAFNSTTYNYGDFPVSNNQANATSATTIPLSEDPTNRAFRNGGQYDYLTSGSGIGNIYVNAKWLFKLSGLYNLPYDINVSAFYNARQGYPFEQGILSPSRTNGGNTVFILLNNTGDNRLPNYQNLDFHLDRKFRFATATLVPSLDIFNVTNFNTVQAIRGTQNAANANQIQAILAPRVIRFGLRFNW